MVDQRVALERSGTYPSPADPAAGPGLGEPTPSADEAAGYELVEIPRRNPDGTPTLDSDGDPVTDPHFRQPDGSTAPLAEINSVGIDIDGTPDLTGDHPDGFNENTLRDEFGWPRRDNY